MHSLFVPVKYQQCRDWCFSAGIFSESGYCAVYSKSNFYLTFICIFKRHEWTYQTLKSNSESYSKIESFWENIKTDCFKEGKPLDIITDLIISLALF